MIPVAEALAQVLALISPTGTEDVPLDAADTRALAAPIVATRTQPPFAASAMDGYALRADEAPAGANLRVIGEAAAGRAFTGKVGMGEAVRIFTGAPVPDSADTILIQEDADRSGDRITVREAARPGAHIRPAGGDFFTGAEIPSPRRLSPRDIALAAAMNCPKLTVRRRPVIALIPTGDELVMPGEVPGPDQIVSSNNFGLAALIARAGGQPRLLPIARDTPDSLRAAFASARDADLIITLGGASVGDHDLVQSTAADEGLDLSFYKIAMRPGKPLMAGRLGGTPMLGLPGNPVSAMVCGTLFIEPAIHAFLGLPAPDRAFTAPLAHALPANGPREHYMRARREPDGSVTVFDCQDSSLLSVLHASDTLAIRPPHAKAAPAGQDIRCLAL
ncbi:molybdopterin molybdotransferase MoeA [Algicella marina]|uniref:Molybdopterin molybdenumtransferase n=1 Tax=Algicella marina TaxID=2683284 RepID=A0A6P1SY99_9RHOB|nr:gephyrin-like molybdotransferase Glp [Algicella marina]QHQ34727.1 molybdopterin molybdenumtransferase MoeA [Algicella marina]